MPFHAIEEAVEEIRQGRMVILVDDEDRENEGDLVIAAEKITPEVINFMAKYGRGLICLSLTSERADELHLQSMNPENTAAFGTAFTVSIDAAEGITTGISAADRARTIQVAVDPKARPLDLARPGHIFPIKARRGGVLKRAGQTEGSVDLARLAGLYPAGVICEIMNEDGSMSRVPELVPFAEKHHLKIVTIKDLIEFRMRRETFVKRVAEAALPTAHGTFRAMVYEDEISHNTHVALVKGDLGSVEAVLVRVHAGCITGDLFGSKRCDCGEQLHNAMNTVEEEGVGVVLYINQDGGEMLINKMKAYHLQDQGEEVKIPAASPSGLRDYGVGAQILVDLGIRKLRLMTNNPKKIIGLEGFGLQVVERVPIESVPHQENVSYLRDKKNRLGHILNRV
ncbi:MAG: bifunctional 3,4-dihydroxy-2-butanone-4-phosphate synthase/GTP cyclohydrolase II [Nitrospirae bacterium]|nr:bifunctional 3,4-dihydroxy-2-butanone-4-phosphate synthase/GTP cyclohydrolase II [Nitrospirota bacterium]